jgi:hypothetical protein
MKLCAKEGCKEWCADVSTAPLCYLHTKVRDRRITGYVARPWLRRSLRGHAL